MTTDPDDLEDDDDDQDGRAALPKGPPRFAQRRRALTVADVARHRGTTRAAALRWLRRHASRFLYQGARGLVINARNYAVLQHAHSASTLSRRLEALEDSHAMLEKRVTAHANALSRLRAL